LCRAGSRAALPDALDSPFTLDPDRVILTTASISQDREGATIASSPAVVVH